jgi:parallel beta-helix repeat protein
VRQGTYRESVDIERRVTLQPEDGDVVRVRGSDVVTDFVPDGTRWRLDGWNPDIGRGREVSSSLVDDDHPLAADPDMVFYDGAPLRQVRPDQLGPGTFAVDRNDHHLFLADNPVGHVVEATTRRVGIDIRADGSTVRGLGVDRFGTLASEFGAVRAWADDVSVTDMLVTHNAAAGISGIGSGVEIARNTATNNGQLGIHAHHLDAGRIVQNVASRNNTERFSPEAAAGGIKITATRGVTVDGNRVEMNAAKGIWLDVSTKDAVLVRNLVQGNSGPGLMAEVSARLLIAGNVAIENDRGIYVLESNDVRIWNNTLLRNERNIDVLEGRRDALTGRGSAGFEPPYDDRGPNPDPQVSWNVDRVAIRNNVLSAGQNDGPCGLSTDDINHERSADDMHVSADFDVFHRPNDVPHFLACWANWPTSRDTFPHLGDFVTETGEEVHGWLADQLGLDEAGEHFAIPADRVEQPGTPVPADVADVLGVPEGSTPVGVPR